jgi:hypothetical protein
VTQIPFKSLQLSLSEFVFIQIYKNQTLHRKILLNTKLTGLQIFNKNNNNNNNNNNIAD